MLDVLTLDYETEGIEARPKYPPVPVGVALRHPDGRSEYIHWGHPDSENRDYEYNRAVQVINHYFDKGSDVLCHNAAFDMDVAQVHMPEINWPTDPLKTHDTQFLLYLYNPHARELGLKPSAEQILDWPPEERDELEYWIKSHIPGINKKNNPWGAHIAEAPSDIVGPYAIGDVDRTFELYAFLMPYMERNSMVEAYKREQRLMPILLESERKGLRVDTNRLADAVEYFDNEFQRADQEICQILGRQINVNSGYELAEALAASEVCGELPRTPTGKLSTARKSLEGAVTDQRLLALLRYRGAAKTCLGTFMHPWLELSTNANGRLHTHWHQTRNPEGFGTRTGRISSSKPNLTNVPNEFKAKAPDGYQDLPMLRQFLLPEEGHVWLKRDYSAQEVRIMAHFEDGALMKAFQDDPNLDPHQFASDVVTQQTGFHFERKKVKIIAFSILYGSGIRHLSETLEAPYHEAAMAKGQYLGAFPNVSELMADIKNRGRAGLPVRTLGGRLLFSEPPNLKTGQRYDYKLLNHLIQGSAGDVTKQALINYDEVKEHGQIQSQVYDELNVSAPYGYADVEMERLKKAMQSVPCDVILLTEGYVGSNWMEADKHDN